MASMPVVADTESTADQSRQATDSSLDQAAHDHSAQDHSTLAHQGGHHCHSPAETGNTGLSSDHHHDSHHSSVHELMACDCLLCKLVQAPALAPAWLSDMLVQRSLQVSQDTLAMGILLLPHTQPPSRAPPR
ncbi:MAG: hypothetical protein EA349_11800 [Halomonadaceae bacterium]|nr:MAG: hypothetical protein EA349_11800 [Halomonadaceae bacterium]